MIPEDYLNSLPMGAVVVKHSDETLNHEIVFVNEPFIKTVGYVQSEIPDKETWWGTAYPDEVYQKFVERQWELAVETFDENQDKYVTLDVEIRTKSNGAKKFRVFSEMTKHMIPGHYVVMFMELD